MTRPPRFILNYDTKVHPQVVQMAGERGIPVAELYRSLVEVGLKAEKRLGGKSVRPAPIVVPEAYVELVEAIQEPETLAPIEVVLQNEGVTEAFPPAPTYTVPTKPIVLEKPKPFKAISALSLGPIPRKPGSMLKVKK